MADAALRNQLFEAWYRSVLAGYPARTAEHLAAVDDPFANPVGARLKAGLEVIVDGLFEQREVAELAPALDGILRVRAVQDRPPSHSLTFLVDLKEIAGRILPGDDAVDRWIDCLLLAAVDVYVACRNEMHATQVRAIRRQSVTVLERLNAWCAAKYEGDDGSRGPAASPNGEETQ